MVTIQLKIFKDGRARVEKMKIFSENERICKRKSENLGIFNFAKETSHMYSALIKIIFVTMKITHF